MSSDRDDAAARAAAVRTDLSVLLEAPAGSGKTSVLTERLLALLATVDEPEQVLAVTFTRKAAAEMRARVLQALSGRLQEQKPHHQRLRELAARVHQHSEARGWNLAEHPARLRIQTLDALNVSIAAQAPLAGGTLTSAIADRPDDLYERAARRTLIDAASLPGLRDDVDLLFTRLDNQWARMEALLTTMLQRRAHWLDHLISDHPLELRERITRSLRAIVGSELARNLRLIPPDVLATAGGWPDRAPLTADPGSLESWRQLARIVLTDKGTVRKRIDKSVPDALKLEPHKTRLRELLATLEADEGAIECLVRTRTLPPVGFNDADSAAFDALARLLPFAARVLYVEFAAAGRVDHAYIAGAARAALTEQSEATDLALRFGARLRHILIDEFQDTSIAQFELLRGLVQDWSAGDGRTLFVVGDPMQSIYQFREAEVGLFLRVRDEGLGPVKLESLRLTRNFRARPALVKWNNALFERIFPRVDDIRLGAIRFSPSLAARAASESTSITLEALPEATREQESAAVVARVLDIRRRDPTGSLAILVPARKHAVPVALKLVQAGIAVRGIDLVPLQEVPAARDLVALALAIDHAGHRAAWLSVLRAPWCGLTLRSLQALSGRRDSQLLSEALREESRLDALDADERARVVRVRDILAEAIPARASLAPHELLEATWMRLGGQDLYDEAGLEAVRAVLGAMASAVAAREWRDAFSLEPALAALYAAPDPAANHVGAVEIMTVHGAKGLEFDHVVLPGFAGKPRSEEVPLLRWLDLPGESGDELLMAPIVAAEDRNADLLGRYISDLGEQRRRHERRRLLYVALTRARESLHVIAAIPRNKAGALAPAKNSLLEAGWRALESQFREIDVPASPAGPWRVPEIQRLPLGWRLPDVAFVEGEAESVPAAEATPVEFSWVGETARHIGTVTHRALQRRGIEGLPVDRAAIRRELGRRGVAALELDGAANTVAKALEAVQEDERGRWLFDAKHRDASSEVPLSGLESGRIVHAIIDRMFIDEKGTRWVIDFKTSSHSGGALEAFLDNELERYRPQLERYMRLAGSLGPQPVQGALYFPLLRAFRVLERTASAQ